MSNAKLTKEQELKILKEWNSRQENPPSLLELIKISFPDKDVDGRSREGRAVKEFLATRQIKARGAHEYQYKEKIYNILLITKEYINYSWYIVNLKITWRTLFKHYTSPNVKKSANTVISEGVIPVLIDSGNGILPTPSS